MTKSPYAQEQRTARRSIAYTRRDLWVDCLRLFLALVVTLLCSAVLWFTLSLPTTSQTSDSSALDLMRYLAAGLLLFVLPGYGLSKLLIPAYRIDPGIRLIFTMGFSLTTSVLGGFLINLTPDGFVPLTELLLLSTVTFFTLVLAMVRTIFSVRKAEPVDNQPRPPRRGLIFGLKAWQIAVMGLALLVSIAAILVSRYGAQIELPSAFTQFWMSPLDTQHDGVAPVEIGVSNHESQEVVYQVQMVRGGKVIETWANIDLVNNDSWTLQYRIPTVPIGEVIVNLYLQNDLTQIYRHAQIWVGTPGSGIANTPTPDKNNPVNSATAKPTTTSPVQSPTQIF